MSFISAINKSIIAPMTKRVGKFAHITDSMQREASQEISASVENLTHLVKEVQPENFHSIQRSLKDIERYGLSQGDIKYLMLYEPDIIQKLEILADKKLINALLKRKNILQEGVLGCVTKENKKAFIRLLNDKNITDEDFKIIVNLISEENVPILKQLLKDKTFNSKLLADLPITHLRKDNVNVLRAISNNGNVSTQEMLYIMTSTNKSNSDIALKLLEMSGENTKGLSSILDKVYAFEGMSKDNLKVFELRKKFITELLENPKFKLGTDNGGMENYLISEIISGLKPENYKMSKKILLDRNVNLSQLPDFLKSVTPENQAVAEKLLNMVSKDTKLPYIEFLDPNVATKYLDEVTKINNPKAKNLYIEAMGGLNERRFDEILDIIKTTKPENAEYASKIISCLHNSSLNITEIKSIINTLEQSGRKLNNQLISNLALVSEIKEVPVASFIERIVKNKAIPDNELVFLTDKYISVAQKLKSKNFKIPQNLYEKLSRGEITKTEFDVAVEKLKIGFAQNQAKNIGKLPDILENLYKNKNLNDSQIRNIFSQISLENMSVVEKYALSSNIAKIDLATIQPKYIDDLESLLKIDMPSWYQRDLLPILKSAEKGGEKRLKLLQELFKREKTPSVKTIAEAVKNVDEETLKYIDDIIARKDLTPKQVLFVLDSIKRGDNIENLMKLVKDTNIKGKYLNQVFEESGYKVYEQYPELAKKALDLNVPLQVLKGNFGSNTVAITDVIGEKKFANMLKGIEQAKGKYGIIPEDLYLADIDGANDLFITLRQSKHGKVDLVYKFNKKTGNLVTIIQGEKSINVSKGTQIFDSFASEVKIANAPATPYRISSVTEGRNGKVGTIYTESAIKGQYDIYHTKPDGSRVRIGHAQITPNGAKHVRRTLTSVDGSKTYTAFREDKLGNSYFHSVITDRTGKQISEVKRTFKVISKNHFVSTFNGKSYDIVFNNKNVVVTKLDSMGKKTAEKIEYAIKDVSIDTANEIIRGLENLADDKAYIQATGIFKKYGIEPRTIDRSCVEMLKRLPGDEWFAMSKSCEFVMPQSHIPGNACYAGNSIFMSKELNNNLGIFAHELGHAKFHVLDLAKDKELMKIYNAEKRAYTAKFPEARIASIDYFLEKNNVAKRGLNEACAETNLMTDTIQTWDQLQDRTIFLEQYFPNTIAHIRQKYSKLV